MLTVADLFPLAKAVLTCVLHTGLTTVAGNFFAGIGFLIALAADLVFLVRMC